MLPYREEMEGEILLKAAQVTPKDIPRNYRQHYVRRTAYSGLERLIGLRCKGHWDKLSEVAEGLHENLLIRSVTGFHLVEVRKGHRVSPQMDN